MILSKFNGGQNSYELHLQPDGSVRSNVSSDGTTLDALISGAGVVSTGVWFHVATTFNAGDWRIYVNGVQVASKASVVTSIFTGTRDLLIGRDTTTGHNFNGLIDEAEVFSVELEMDARGEEGDTFQETFDKRVRALKALKAEASGDLGEFTGELRAHEVHERFYEIGSFDGLRETFEFIKTASKN